MRSILQKKKVKILILDFFFWFECCYDVMMIVLTVLTDITNLVEGHNNAKLGLSCVKRRQNVRFLAFKKSRSLLKLNVKSSEG